MDNIIRIDRNNNTYKSYMQEKGLELAPQKTEAILLNGKKRCGPMNLRTMVK